MAPKYDVVMSALAKEDAPANKSRLVEKSHDCMPGVSLPLPLELPQLRSPAQLSCCAALPWSALSVITYVCPALKSRSKHYDPRVVKALNDVSQQFFQPG